MLAVRRSPAKPKEVVPVEKKSELEKHLENVHGTSQAAKQPKPGRILIETSSLERQTFSPQLSQIII